ncbi:hypothetical protein SNE40_020133 [Patella caerulea]|uniref:Uncharacterized protein n=1 Tax=Patella caerulea TaxID=87958 RepID=A0AAN8G3D9_PATCE
MSGSSRTPKTNSDHIRKTLFQTPVLENMRYASNNTNKILNIMSKLQVERDTEIFIKEGVKEAHEGRLKELKELVKTLEDDDWRYPPVEKLLGIQ